MALPTTNHSPGSPDQTADSILGHYLSFLKTAQGLANATLVLRRLHVEPFLRSLEKAGVLADLRGLAPSTVHDYIIATSKPLTRASRKHLVSGLRSFLRFAHANSLLERSLVDAVPVILTRKLDRLPEALLSYLRERGEAPSMEEVFLTVRGVQRPLGVNNHLGTTLRSYYLRAGLRSTRCGAHPIRHAFATRLMEQGTPLKDIADLLGHRSIETTFLYTKVDLERLRTLAAEWPEVKP